MSFWVASPLLGALQAVLLLIVWIHGCIGVHFWLRLKPFYPRAKALLLANAVLLPALALLGYYQGGERAWWRFRTRRGGRAFCLPNTLATRLRTLSF